MFTQFINLNYLNNIIREPIHQKKKKKKKNYKATSFQDGTYSPTGISIVFLIIN